MSLIRIVQAMILRASEDERCELINIISKKITKDEVEIFLEKFFIQNHQCKLEINENRQLFLIYCLSCREIIYGCDTIMCERCDQYYCHDCENENELCSFCKQELNPI